MKNSTFYKEIRNKYSSRIALMLLLILLSVTALFILQWLKATSSEKYGIILFVLFLTAFETYILISLLKSKAEKTKEIERLITLGGFDDVRLKDAKPDLVKMKIVDFCSGSFILRIRNKEKLLFEMIYGKKEKTNLLKSLDPLMKNAGIRIMVTSGLEDEKENTLRIPELSYFVFET